MSTDDDLHRQFPLAVPVIMSFCALVVSALAFVGWARTWGEASRSQPLTITACTPETYTPPADGDRGPGQPECDRWFDTTGDDTWGIDDPIVIAGQVCLDADEPVAYQLEVSWRSIDGRGRYGAINVPVSYEPGCREPYSFEYLFPGTPADTGRWKLVGTATPVDRDRFTTYQWDAAGTVTLIP